MKRERDLVKPFNMHNIQQAILPKRAKQLHAKAPNRRTCSKTYSNDGILQDAIQMLSTKLPLTVFFVFLVQDEVGKERKNKCDVVKTANGCIAFVSRYFKVKGLTNGTSSTKYKTTPKSKSNLRN